MRVIVGCASLAAESELRQVVSGTGMDCQTGDCVVWQELPTRLGKGDADLVLLCAGGDAEAPWKVLDEVKDLTQAPVMVVGRGDDAALAKRARNAGVADVIDEQDLRRSLDAAIERWQARGTSRKARGRVIAVYSATPGSGVTTIAANLAGALNRRHRGAVALIELAREYGDLALLLNVRPRHTAEDVCRRWRTLDKTSLRTSLTEHSSGLQTLLNGGEACRNECLDGEASRRLAILVRMTMPYTVVALDAVLTEVELETMRLSDATLYVVRPDVPAVKRAQRMWQQLASQIPRERVRLVVNRFGQSGQLSLSHIEEALGLRAMHLIPDDPGTVNRAANLGRLLHEQSRLRKICRRFTALAHKVNGNLGRAM